MIKFNHLLVYLTKFTRFTGELSHILTVLQPPYEENECLQQDIKHPPVSEAIITIKSLKYRSKLC